MRVFWEESRSEIECGRHKRDDWGRMWRESRELRLCLCPGILGGAACPVRRALDRLRPKVSVGARLRNGWGVSERAGLRVLESVFPGFLHPVLLSSAHPL